VGGPGFPKQLWWVLSGAQYARNFFSRDLLGVFRHLVPGRWWMDFGWGLLPLAAGMAVMVRRRAVGSAAVWLSLLAALTLLSVYTIADDVGYWMPVGCSWRRWRAPDGRAFWSGPPHGSGSGWRRCWSPR